MERCNLPELMRMCSEYFVKKLMGFLMQIDCSSNMAISFSGGLDSSVIAFLSKEKNPKLYTVGVGRTTDVKNAMEIAEIYKFPLNVINIHERDIVHGVQSLLKIDPFMSAVEVSFELPLYFVAKYSSEITICTGQGADELFGGYAKYLATPERMKDDLDNLLVRTLPREQRIVAMFGKRLSTPYLNEDIIKFANSIPDNCKIMNGGRKWILREAARCIGVPEMITKREKKAAQYGSGIWKVLKRYAKESNISVEAWVRKNGRS